ncbi:hypothetical protein L5G32_17945 [Gordonia sp. HY002]|uniref:hypothetical protein n=1 Tax=Gordonia zhenghanii TaxID=2911516 RepID=UPI001EF04574|nr:hypothetical protein [Gordonia zhenghanii]MCF8572145.1 hypothetical protein [Gordonia zhenghanii]MCF8604271.1 hypothetical protein [Gordonia zhenghanii]
MAVPTHIIDNGKYASWVGPNEDLYSFLTPLQVMDGENRYMGVMFQLIRPGWNGDLSQEELDHSRENFVQAAGSSEAMTVEVRSGHGESACLYTVGRLPADSRDKSGSPSVEVRRADNTTLIFSDEVFNAEEAADIFYHYYKNDSIPEPYFLRKTIW